jgi:2-polyprenyl-6-methoxyphenol hydroxylase-like FAD-dependent oxidoreductase
MSLAAGSLEVLIVGAGPTGLTLACDLARRGVAVRIIDTAPQPFAGSRAKGVQPRTLEVFDDLGVLDAALAVGASYPKMAAHFGPLTITWQLHKRRPATPDVPHPNILLLPQWQTDALLRERLAAVGLVVEQSTEFVDLAQDDSGVTVTLQHGGRTEAVRCHYVVGADGGSSTVRRCLGVGFAETTTDEERMIVADARVEGIPRKYWHVWPRAKGGMVGLCPLPNTDRFQLIMQLPAGIEPDLSEAAIASRLSVALRSRKIRLHELSWVSLFRPNVRMVDRYRIGRVFLAGDAAHVHTPLGAQGMNTGIQDAYNLGWKLRCVLDGAPTALLDTYQQERLPVAARVLGLSNDLYQDLRQPGLPKPRRGDEERQLAISYRGSDAAVEVGAVPGPVRAGDRAPDAPCLGPDGPTRLFEQFRGPHFTLVAIGLPPGLAAADLPHDPALAHLAAIVDTGGHIAKAYGLRASAVVVVRPDGYVGLIATRDHVEALRQYWRLVGRPTGE